MRAPTTASPAAPSHVDEGGRSSLSLCFPCPGDGSKRCRWAANANATAYDCSDLRVAVWTHTCEAAVQKYKGRPSMEHAAMSIVPCGSDDVSWQGVDPIEGIAIRVLRRLAKKTVLIMGDSTSTNLWCALSCALVRHAPGARLDLVQHEHPTPYVSSVLLHVPGVSPSRWILPGCNGAKPGWLQCGGWIDKMCPGWDRCHQPGTPVSAKAWQGCPKGACPGSYKDSFTMTRYLQWHTTRDSNASGMVVLFGLSGAHFKHSTWNGSTNAFHLEHRVLSNVTSWHSFSALPSPLPTLCTVRGPDTA